MLCLGLAFLLLVPVYVDASPDALPDVTRNDRALVRIRGQSDVLALRELGISIIEEYEGYVLGWIPRYTAKLLSNWGVDVIVYPERRPVILGSRVIDRSPASRPLTQCGGSSDLYLLQMIGPTKGQWLAVLERAGAKIHSYVPHDAFLLSAPPEALSLIRSAHFIQWLVPYQAEWKLDGLELPPTGELVIDALVQDSGLYLDRDTWRDIEVMRASKVGRLEIATLRVTADDLSVLLCDPSILRVTAATPPFERADEIAVEIVGGAYSGTGAQVNFLGYNGTGVIVGHTDSGLDDGDVTTMHPDLAGRVLGLTDYGDGHEDWPAAWYGDNVAEDAFDSHGTAVAGIIAGNGAVGVTDNNGFLLGWGIAPQAYLLSQRIFGDVGDQPGLRRIDKYDYVLGDESYNNLVRELVMKDATVSQNSWGAIVEHAPYQGQSPVYDGLTRDADPNQAGDQQMTFVFAAGNEGLDPEKGTLRVPATAKNVITVGGTENYRPEKPLCRGLTGWDANNPDEIFLRSSRGPTQDGRIKPDIVAPAAIWVATARSSASSDVNLLGVVCELVGTSYLYYVGTSFSAPHVSGAVALFTQRFKKDYSTLPSPALVRAALVNTAVDMPSTGTPHGTGPIPNRDEGWGRLDALALLNPPQPRYYSDQQWLLQTSQTARFEFTVSDISKPIKVTLAWTDPPGVLSCNPCLVNDLNLLVTSPGGTVYRGNVFNSGWSTTGGAADALNNLENVYIQAPTEGTYVVEIFAQSVNQDAVSSTSQVDQDFALVVSNGVRRAVAPSLTINNGAAGTNQQTVTLTTSASTPQFVQEIRFRNEGTPSTTTESFGLDAAPYDGWQDYGFVLEPFDRPDEFQVNPDPDPFFKTVESLHPYPNQVATYSWTVNGNSGTVRMEVGFTRIELAGDDSITVRNDQGQTVFTTSTSGISVWTGPIMTNSLTISLKTLGGGSAWGFLSEIYNYDTATGNPYPSGYRECWFVDYNPLFVTGNHRVRIQFGHVDTYPGDFVTLYDSTGLRGSLSGFPGEVWTNDLFGDLFGDVKVCFTSDQDGFGGEGFRIQHVRAFVGYSRGLDRWWEIRKAGVSTIQAHFSITDISAGDSLTLLADSGGSLSIDPSTRWSSVASGDRIRANLRSNTDFATGSGGSDEAGFVIDQIRYQDYAWSAWESFATAQTKQWTLPSGDGTKTVYAQLRDRAGQIYSISDTIALDTVAPSFTGFNINNNADSTTSRRVTLYITASDPSPSSGLLMRFRNDDAFGTGSWSSWLAYASTRAWGLHLGYGERCVDAEIKDNADNLPQPTQLTDCIFVEPEEPPPPCKPGQVCSPVAAVWTGTDFVDLNNVLPGSEDFSRPDFRVSDAYVLDVDPETINGNYELQLREYGSETAYVDSFALWAIEHNTGITPYVDRDGRVILVGDDVRSPSLAAHDGMTITEILAASDDLVFAGERGDLVTVQFDECDDLDEAYLLARSRGKASYEPLFVDVYGSRRGETVWQGSIRSRTGWSHDFVPLAGMACTKDRLEIELRWLDTHELDEVLLVRAETARVSINRLPLVMASHSTDGGIVGLLDEVDDGSVTLRPGEHLSLSFEAKSIPRGRQQTLYVTISGFYVLEWLGVAGFDQAVSGDSAVFSTVMANPASDDYYLYDISKVEWDFGDGAQGRGEEVHHDYTRPGAYEVVMTVTWADGTIREYRKIVEIA